MTRTLAYTLLAVFAAMSVAVVAARPEWVSDQNSFLKDFVGANFLNLLGVILAITLASVANIHLEFNKIEERHQRVGLNKSRANLRKATYWLIALFVSAVALVAVKPILCGGRTAEASINMAALLIVLWHVLILISLTQLVFSMSPDVKTDAGSSPQ